MSNPLSRRNLLVGASSLFLQAPSPSKYGAILAELSDRETGPAADNFVSNEDSYPRVTSEIARTVPPNTAYLGVGPDQNFTFIAHARPSLAVIVDYRKRNQLLHLLHKALFTLSENRVEYLSLLTARKPQVANDASAEGLVTAFTKVEFDRTQLEVASRRITEFLRPLSILSDADWPTLQTIHARLAGPGMNARFLALTMYPTFGKMIATPSRDNKSAHFLADERLYQVVRNTHRHDAILPLIGDFANGPCLTKLADFLRKSRQEIGLFYISDVEFFLLRAGKFANYIQNLERLPWARNAQIIRTSTREINHPERVKGDSSTTIIRPFADFLAHAKSGKIQAIDDLFA